MDGWASRLCALLVMLAISACDGSDTATEHDRAAVAAKPLTAAGMLAKTAFDLPVMQATNAVPQIINPTEELREFDPHGILRWSAVADADAYEVWVFLDAALSELQEFSGALSSRQYRFTTLGGYGTYYVKLYYRVNGAWADAPPVTINTTVLVFKPRLTNSQEELEALAAGGTLRWTTVSGADVYELWVFRDEGLEAFAETSGQVRIPQYQLRTLEAGRTYYAQVYSRDTRGNFFVGGPLPIRIVASSTVARIVNPQEELDAFASNGLLRWSAVSGATAYEAWIFTNPNSSVIQEASGSLTTRTYATRALQPGGTYFAQIYALVEDQWQVGSPVKIVTASAATIARLTNPQEELEAFSTTGTLRWSEVPGADAYEVWIYGNAGLGVETESGVGANRAYTVAKLCRDATYYAQVYARLNGQWTVGWATRLDVTQGTSPDNCSPPVPDVRLSASATEVTAGQSVTLTWSTRFAQSCTASDGWSGATPLSGAMLVGPVATTTRYTLTCTGASGASRAQVLIATVAVVPDVVGLTAGAADLAIAAAGFVVGAVSPATSSTVPAGQVISQSPGAGQFAVSGGKVNYVVSTGNMVVVPNVVGMARNAAITVITSAGLTIGTVSGVISTLRIEDVISQSPPGGELVALGSAVNLLYSTGGGMPQIRTVPDVVGMTQAEATSAITSVGLTVGTVTTGSSATVPAGRVFFQNPYAGMSVALPSSVDLAISTGIGQ